ncbi:response regulator transcription factor [Paenibacillus sp. y28]|uniref:response regulator transcription factor n=1 Tax=Paenibacillus sp. y28 TaxID=3129110 RepID=UPI003019170C
MSENAPIFIVDDEPHICEVIRLYVQHAGFSSVVFHHGLDALAQVEAQAPQLLLLDVMLPELSGFDICERLRAMKAPVNQTPVIMLTAKGEVTDKLRGFNLGIDDYIVKPFDPYELMARMKAVLRRTRQQLSADPVDAAPPSASARVVDYRTLLVDLDQYKVMVDGRRQDLTLKETELLYFMASSPNRVFSREELLAHVWNYDFQGGTRTVDAHVKNIRKKLGSHDGWRIETYWGVGYSFEVHKG